VVKPSKRRGRKGHDLPAASRGRRRECYPPCEKHALSGPSLEAEGGAKRHWKEEGTHIRGLSKRGPRRSRLSTRGPSSTIDWEDHILNQGERVNSGRPVVRCKKVGNQVKRGKGGQQWGTKRPVFLSGKKRISCSWERRKGGCLPRAALSSNKGGGPF